jgi:hypothetical protein
MMDLIKYSDLFNTPSLYRDYKVSGHKMFSEYMQACCGLMAVYECKKQKVKHKGFRIEDKQKWMLTKIKHELPL